MESEAGIIESSRSRGGVIWLAILVFAGLSTWISLHSDGFLEADSCTHYVYARGAAENSAYLLDIWGRPVCTGIYAIPAWLGGRAGAQGMSLAIAVLLAWLTYRIAVGQGYRRPVLALIFTLGQPLVFFHSFSVLTELPFATLLAGGFLAYQRRRWLVMAVIVSLMPLSRPEGFGFILLAAAALLLHKRWWWVPLLVIPLGVWSYLGWAGMGGHPGYPWWQWLRHAWPYSAKSTYEAGTLLHFVGGLPVVVSPLVFPAVCFGICLSWRIWRGRESGGATTDADTRHLRRCEGAIVAIPLGILIVHSLLYWTGRMASSGELRYMLVAAPFWALLGTRGWDWSFARMRLAHPVRWAGVAVLLPLAPAAYLHVLVPHLQDDWRSARQFMDLYDRSPLRKEYPTLLAAHPYIFYFSKERPDLCPKLLEWGKREIDHPRAGVMLVWDSVYGQFNSDDRRVVRLDEIAAAGWIPQPEMDAALKSDKSAVVWRVFLSPKPAGGSRAARGVELRVSAR